MGLLSRLRPKRKEKKKTLGEIYGTGEQAAAAQQQSEALEALRMRHRELRDMQAVHAQACYDTVVAGRDRALNSAKAEFAVGSAAAAARSPRRTRPWRC